MKLHCLDVTLYPTNYELSYSVAATEGVLFPRLQYIGQILTLKISEQNKIMNNSFKKVAVQNKLSKVCFTYIQFQLTCKYK